MTIEILRNLRRSDVLNYVKGKNLSPDQFYRICYAFEFIRHKDKSNEVVLMTLGHPKVQIVISVEECLSHCELVR